jgi:hypothetical protein
VCRNYSVCFGDVLGLFRISDCIGRHTQLIWNYGMQESVLFVLGDLLGVP